MERILYEKLEAWENKSAKEPLLVIGARQTGKTWLIRKFINERYADSLYLNLEFSPELISAFDGSLDPAVITNNIGQLTGRRITSSTTLFIDEIQESERAITALKYFCESEENYRVIGAGSLLGVKLKRFKSSFPVGKVKLLNMYPMNFEEFLLACGEEVLRDGIREAYLAMRALPSGIHDKALRLYHDYLVVGGMPRAVQSYLAEGRSAQGLDPDILRDLETAYLADMTKYTTSAAEGVKITEVFKSIPRQLSRENPKFKYNEIRPGANSRDFLAPVDWLDAAGLIHRVCRAETVRNPLESYINENTFKAYLSDVGLLCSMGGIRQRYLMPGEHNIYKGGVIENYVMQELAALNLRLAYYKPSESMEIDLLLDTDAGIVPVEIKSGRRRRSTSLKNYREKYKPAMAIRISETNFGEIDGIRSVPLYAVFCMGNEF